MRLGNPAVRRYANKAECGGLGYSERKASYLGVYLKAALFAVITVIAAVLTEFMLLRAIAGEDAQALVGMGIGAAVGAVALLIISLVIVFVPSTAKFLGFIYAAMQGGLLGILTAFVDMIFPGIAFAAFIGTAIVFVVSIIVNSVCRVVISSNLLRGFLVAFASFAVLQLLMWILSMFGIFNFRAYIWIQLACSALCIVWATVMLFFDLNNIDYIVQTGADKRYEWNVAFSLTTTLIYMYIEILELLVRLAAIFSSKN
ncbi:MAG: Bax inhibitor-1/YccA family protein [Roseburia sp.]|nr:Bax inhibitor-1/YccA family protein [Roseburia sp.]